MCPQITMIDSSSACIRRMKVYSITQVPFILNRKPQICRPTPFTSYAFGLVNSDLSQK